MGNWFRDSLLSLGACAIGFLATTSPSSAAQAPVSGFSYIRSAGGIDEYRLDSNGLQVLLKADHSAPVVTFNVTYRVGSRNEVTGATGATHILEHMMFKGSEGFNDPKGNSVKQYLEANGASYNATTSRDRTNYYGTLGKDALEGYIAIEADRMRHLWLRESDRQAEMTVVRNEYELDENDPTSALRKEVIAAMFLAHPYHHSTIGWRSDIERVPIEKLKAFYDIFYWPNNATVTIVGDIEPVTVLGLVKRYYGAIPRSPQPIPEVYTQEPSQLGARRIVLKRTGQLGTVMIGYKIPPALHADMPALKVLGSILMDGKGSRFYSVLVDANLARGASVYLAQQRDPGMLIVNVDLAPGTTHDRAEQIVWAEIDKVKRAGVTDEEVRRVIRQSHAQVAFARDGTAGTAGQLNEWIARGDWTWYVTYPERLARVTSADVQRVARTYLVEDHSTTGWFVPQVPASQMGDGS